MLTRLGVKNFKSIGDQPGVDLKLKPLTVLVGPNGAGKSSILQSLVLLRQSIRHGELNLQGPLKLGDFSDVVFNHSLDRRISMNLELVMDEPPRVDIAYSVTASHTNRVEVGVTVRIDGRPMYQVENKQGYSIGPFPYELDGWVGSTSQESLKRLVVKCGRSPANEGTLLPKSPRVQSTRIRAELGLG